MRDKLSNWLLFLLLVEGVAALTLLLGIALFRMATGN